MQVANAINRFTDYESQRRFDYESAHKPDNAENNRTSTDRLFLNELKPDSVRVFLTDRIMQRLQSMQDSLARFQQASPQYDTKDSVQDSAAKIVNSANSTVKQLAKKTDSTSTINNVKNAIKDEVKNSRRDFDAKNNEVLKELEKIERELNKALGKYPFEMEPEVLTEAIHAKNESLSQSISSSIEIKTKDGDTVTINLQRSSSVETTQFNYSNGNISASGFEQSINKSFSLEFRIEGNLDEDELKSINKLVKNIESVADKFEQGNLNAALKKASKLKFDSSEIASFSASFQSQKQYKAVELYQQTEVVNQQEAASVTPPKLFADLSDLLVDLEDLAAQARETTNLESPETSVKGILEKMAELKEETQGLDRQTSPEDGHLLSNFV